MCTTGGGANKPAKKKAKGSGKAGSNITDSSGKKIGGVSNSETNPALVKLANNGKSGAAGLTELTRTQAAQTGKDTSFKGIWKSLSTGETHAPRQSLLEFGKAESLPNTGPPSQGFKEGAAPKANTKPTEASITTSIPSGSGTSNQDTASSGPAGSSVQPDSLKNMLAIKKNKKRQGKRSLRGNRGGGIGVGAGGVGLNIIT